MLCVLLTGRSSNHHSPIVGILLTEIAGGAGYFQAWIPGENNCIEPSTGKAPRDTPEVGHPGDGIR